MEYCCWLFYIDSTVTSETTEPPDTTTTESDSTTGPEPDTIDPMVDVLGEVLAACDIWFVSVRKQETDTA